MVAYNEVIDIDPGNARALERHDAPGLARVAGELDVEDTSAGMSKNWADFNRDGWPDDVDEVIPHRGVLEKTISDGELRRQMGDHGHERVANYLNSERMASEVADVYESVLADR